MIAHPARPDLTDDIPPLDSLTPLQQAMRKVGLSLQAGHRWRLHPTTPLKCWKVGHRWMTTEDAIRDFIRRRSGCPTQSTPAAPVLSASRRREVEAAHREARKLMRAR
jgi:hypothetical protein